MTKKEKALIYTTIQELKSALESEELSDTESIDVSARVDCLMWVLSIAGK